MKHKKTIKKVAKHLPISAPYIKLRDLQRTADAQNHEIIGLRQAVDRLEARNDEWAAEVRSLRGAAESLTIVWPVSPKDIAAADWTKPHTQNSAKKSNPPFTINWVVPHMGPVSGGHADIFRTINYLESKGHTCNIYFYDALKSSSLDEIKKNLKNYSPLKAKLFYNADNMADCDAIFATNWHTAYPVFNFRGKGKKYYYVQDFEPYFEPVGTYSTLAENTYRFGLRGITLGSWLTTKLSKEYGMECDYFELGLNSKEYHLTNQKLRKKILFYARPVTPRRGFELGVLALEIFHKKHPEYEINFVGWDISPYKIPFSYKNLGILSQSQLNDLYNNCAVALVLSFTNMSLLPLELLASGCRPVVNDSEHTRMVSYSDQLKYSLASPNALAESLHDSINSLNEAQIEEMSEYTKSYEWDNSNKVIEDILLKEL